MHIVELISTRDGQIMETLDNIGIKLFVLCSASVSALQIVFSNSVYESTAKWKTVRVSKRTDCWCAFSWRICNKTAT